MLLQTRWKAILDVALASVSAVGGTPVGSCVWWPSAVIPQGWLLCDGRALLKQTYPELAKVLGTTFGTPSNKAYFSLPGPQGRAILGAGAGSGLTNRALGSTGGAETHTLSVAEMPSHSHGYDYLDNLQSTTPPAGRNLGGVGFTGTTQATGGGLAHNNMQPWIAFNLIIKAS